jgi:hypothetical protein
MGLHVETASGCGAATFCIVHAGRSYPKVFCSHSQAYSYAEARLRDELGVCLTVDVPHGHYARRRSPDSAEVLPGGPEVVHGRVRRVKEALLRLN